MAQDNETDLARLLMDKVRYGRSPIQRWIWENYDQITKAMPGPRRNWRVLSEAATEANLLDADGKKPNANSMRAAFGRVKRVKDTIADEGEPSKRPPRRAGNFDEQPTIAPPDRSRTAARTFMISSPKKET